MNDLKCTSLITVWIRFIMAFPFIFYFAYFLLSIWYHLNLNIWAFPTVSKLCILQQFVPSVGYFRKILLPAQILLGTRILGSTIISRSDHIYLAQFSLCQIDQTIRLYAWCPQTQYHTSYPEHEKETKSWTRSKTLSVRVWCGCKLEEL